ncbi:hypothetical protein HanRHA438_Chr10g0454031 [Helianthus annuus]|nr:hypothetical protein HanRHA438_Chr10g0454031 [Helianthus annuus]
MFLYVNMFSICSDMSDMFCTHLVCFRRVSGLCFRLCLVSVLICLICLYHLVKFSIMYRVNRVSDYVQYPILLSSSYVCFDSVSVPVVSVSS